MSYFDQKVIKQMLEEAGFQLVHARNYCHIITFEYFLRKLSALGVPGAGTLRSVVEHTPLRKLFIPFRIGDIQLFVCEKLRDVSADKPEARQSSGGVASNRNQETSNGARGVWH